MTIPHFGYVLHHVLWLLTSQRIYNPSKRFIQPLLPLIASWCAVDNRANPHLLQLFLKQSKTDPFKQGVKVYIGATDSTICPIQAVLSYLKQRSTKPGPLFITGEGKGWTRTMFSSKLKCILHKLKLSQHSYNTHSFQIGAATSASTWCPHSKAWPLEKLHLQRVHQTSSQWACKAVQDYCNWLPIAYQYSPSTVVSWWNFVVTSLTCVL